MKNIETIDGFEVMGKRHRALVEITTLEALLQKARLIGFSETEIATLRHQYGTGLNEEYK